MSTADLASTAELASTTDLASTSVASASDAAAASAPPVLTLDGVAYGFESLSERARLLTLDVIRTEQEWQSLTHRYRQVLAMDSTIVNTMKEEVEQAGLEPLESNGKASNGKASNGEASSSERPLLTIDALSYDASSIPERVRVLLDDLVRNNQDRSQLEFRLRQLDASRLGYLSGIREELSSSGATPLNSQPATTTTTSTTTTTEVEEG